MKIFKFWWQNPITRKRIIGKTIVKFKTQGCQAQDKFDWVGTVKEIRKNKKMDCLEIVMKIIKHDYSYTDSRDHKLEEETYTWPLVNSDIQNVDGSWLFLATN